MATDSEIREIATSVWETMLGLSIEDTAQQAAESYVTSFVQISGAWQGAVAVELSLRLARVSAAALFGKDESELKDDEIKDAVGEIANVIGGNFKALVPGPSVLSLPIHVRGRANGLPAAKTGLVHAEARFQSASEPVRVVVFEESAGSGKAGA